MSKGKLACTLPWREIVGEANFKRDFLKVVDFVHYLRTEGYDMVTFDKVSNGPNSKLHLHPLVVCCAKSYSIRPNFFRCFGVSIGDEITACVIC
jgi:hypothetical protein